MCAKSLLSRQSLLGTLAVTILLFYPIAAHAQFENRGDLNLNGIPFELADAAIFAEYYAAGMGAFTIDPPTQIAATDIDMDGTTLSQADYTMIVKIVIGYPDPPVPNGSFAGRLMEHRAGQTGTVAGRFDGQVSNLLLEYDASGLTNLNIAIAPGADELNVGWDTTAHKLLIFIGGMFSVSPSMNYVDLIRITTDGPMPINLEKVWGYGYSGEEVVLVVYPWQRVFGDINLNEYSFEIADAVLFTNYFIYGPSVFILDSALQIWATNVNEDELPATAGDYQYFMGVLHGDISPGDPVGEVFGGGLASYGRTAGAPHYFSSSFDSTVGGIFLKFYAPGTTSYAITTGPDFPPNMQIGHDLVDDTLRVLLHGGLDANCFMDDVARLFKITYTGSTTGPVLVHAEASGCSGQLLTCRLAGAGDANFDIKFNVADCVMIISYVFKGGPMAAPLAAADLNCDGVVNVGDVVFYIAWVFKGGPGPTCTY